MSRRIKNRRPEISRGNEGANARVSFDDAGRRRADGFVSKDWQGGLPFTILYDASGKTAYTRMGK
jgi:hypothetical protein